MMRDQTLVRLADRLVREQDEAPSLALDTERGLRRLQRATDAPPTRNRRWLAAVALAAITVAVALWGWSRRSAPLTFEVTQPAVGVGEWLEPSGRTTLGFSDGTRVTVEEGAQARVASIDARGATIELRSGSLHAEVEPRTEARWRMHAGPYSVHVTGTAFIMRWDPDAKRLHIEMLEGSVRVTGPNLGEGRELAAPSRLDVEALSEPVPSPTAKHADTSVAPAPKRARDDRARPSVSWRDLDTKGLRAEAMEEVRRAGIPALASREDAGGLLRLAQIARLEGDVATSQRFLAALRRRYPQSLQAQTATYLSGKSLHDVGEHARAVGELQAYLAMGSDGAFAREARVLLILSLDALGDPRADELARAYLATHGEDVHAPRVRRALRSPVAPTP